VFQRYLCSALRLETECLFFCEGFDKNSKQNNQNSGDESIAACVGLASLSHLPGHALKEVANAPIAPTSKLKAKHGGGTI
jgi:hypothetical protein